MKQSLILMLFTIFIFAIHTKGQSSRFVIQERDTIQLVKANLEDILEDINKFDGKWVEIEGTYIYGYEFSNISPITASKKPQGRIYGLWVDFDIRLFDRTDLYNSLKYLTDKHIKIKGKVNKDRTGHMDQWPGSITNVYYIETFK